MRRRGGRMTNILVVSDAWRPQINGVVRTLEAIEAALPRFGAELSFITPDLFRNVPMPGYPEIRLAFAGSRRLAGMIRERAPDYIHIATEGPLGFAARRACIRNGWRFTTAYHTRFPEYVASRVPIPASAIYAVMRRFHKFAEGTLVATSALERDLRRRGFGALMPWSRGVDMQLFRPRENVQRRFEGPVFLYVGRLAVEKNIDAFLALDLPGTKVVAGDGPDRKRLEATFPDAKFLGALEGEELAAAYSSADVFVFPSRTDTFGLVLLEALASGLPVAAYPVMGPSDVIGESRCGVLDEDLRVAALSALNIPRERCIAHARRFGWEASALQFLEALRRGGEATVRRGVDALRPAPALVPALQPSPSPPSSP